MNKRILTAAIAVFSAMTLAGCTESGRSLTSYVNLFVGTGFTGHTYPGATTPFGMVAASPDTDNTDWDHCSGYKYEDNTIMGFSQTHLSGMGTEEMGDMRLMPITGEPCFEPGPKTDPDRGYRSRFSHSTEVARPGYYAVTLDDYSIRAEMTASPHCAIYRFSFPENEKAGVVFDIRNGICDRILDYYFEKSGDRSIKGYRRTSCFLVKDHGYYGWAEFSETPLSWETSDDGMKMYAEFKPGSTLYIKVGMSNVSDGGAKMNLDAEIPGWNFERVAKDADRLWEKALSKITVGKNESEENKSLLYTSLYHTMMSPNIITDVDGGYYGWDREIHASLDVKYTTYSLWDTYRALHPLYNLIYQDRNVEFINSWLERYRQIGYLPILEIGISETFAMIGIHSLPVLADAIIQGIPGFDYELAYQGMKELALNDTMPHTKGIAYLKELGYLPTELENNSVSKTMEYAYDEWCVARVAEKLGHEEDAEYFYSLARTYRNVYDPDSGFVRGRHENGNWRKPFNPFQVTSWGKQDYTEGNAWQYHFYVPQDVNTYITMNGGEEAFEKKLDDMFSIELSADNIDIPDVTGPSGQYAHGNEPSHHVAYLYNFVGKPEKTQEMVARIKREMYTLDPDGLCGNDDCGQMSAWYILSAVGFYPVTPAIGYFVIGTPTFKEMTLELSSGKNLSIKAPEVSPENVYIQSMTLNGEPYSKSWISVEDIMNGGEICFEMGPEPSAWGTAPEDRPVAVIE
ncbi:MAG: GH92 family glycosyl hydrolase [Bacteroidales bacterium]|nr:GH92 family glycosyl hydrolase [Bacteroidales bacterium]